MAIELLNIDCMELMAKYPDKHFDIAICDPPYGIGADKMKMGTGKQIWAKNKNWDDAVPSAEYFAELERVSKKQIIWGGNYFDLPKTGGWIFWDKELNKDVSFSDGELAWTNFLTTLKKVSCQYSGFLGADNSRIHPTQKPVKLYRNLIKKFVAEGDKILDTHLGSASIAIAVDSMNKFERMNLSLTASEIDEHYYNDAIKRYKNETAQNLLQF